MNEVSFEDIQAHALQLSDAFKVDVVLLNASIEPGLDLAFIETIQAKKKYPSLLLMLVTEGGSADVAYKIARYAQNNYEEFSVFVSGYCKSSGTLCALGAHEIIMSDQGELGPLDVQLRQKDDLGERNSGLVIEEALGALEEKVYYLFQRNFVEILNRSRGQISFKLATKIASEITIGLFAPIYEQIDPVKVGDIVRSMTIAKKYGERLRASSKNFDETTLDKLVHAYPSHNFVIDRIEAKSLFSNLREPRPDEELLAQMLGPLSRIQNDEPCIFFLSDKESVQDTPESVQDTPSAKEPSNDTDETSL